jgi:hypothetical protein
MRLTLKLIFLAGVAIPTYSSASVAERISWQCHFPPEFQVPLTFVYERGSSQGLLVGNVGTADVWVYEGSVATSFMEPVQSGTVQTTTIGLASGKAVHSRHTLRVAVEGSFIQSQSLGDCKRTD